MGTSNEVRGVVLSGISVSTLRLLFVVVFEALVQSWENGSMGQRGKSTSSGIRLRLGTGELCAIEISSAPLKNSPVANAADGIRLRFLGTAFESKTVTWLILPVVICLSQRLSHACLSINCFIL